VSQSGAALAALRVLAVDFDLGGQPYSIPPLPASEWLEVVWNFEDEPLPFLHLLSDDEQADIMWAMLGGTVTVEELAQRCREILAAVSGRRWWEADRLIRSSAASWGYIGGELTRRGVDLDKVSLAAALNVIYVICVLTMTADERKKFDFELSVPPVNATPEEASAAEAESFQAFLGALGPPPSSPA